MTLYGAVRDLELTIDDVATQRREAAVSSEFTRVTTTVVLKGRGETGEGEDVTYAAEAHDDFPRLRERATMSLAEYSSALDAYDLEDYRRWAFESAGLDLALRQNAMSLADALGSEYSPVRFVVSTRLEIRPWLEVDPELEFKLDPMSAWTDEHMREISATGAVRVLDLKGQYHGTVVDQPPDPRLYRSVAEIFPDAVIEDPALTDETRAALRGAEKRLSWDAPIHSVADIEERAPRFVNIKPSRFGTVQRLFDAIDYCNGKGITMYGGGQFELGPGRQHIQRLASLFYADSPSDVAPSEYNVGGPRAGLPRSPLVVSVARGL
jgi:L-alanine-DL-glutamate epimerase-like enolase superfamily enzyme